MKKRKHVLLLPIFVMIVLQIGLLDVITENARRINCFSAETAYEHLRNHTLTEEQMFDFMEAADYDLECYSELLTMYFSSGSMQDDPDVCRQELAYAKKYRSDDFYRIKNEVSAVWRDLRRFPVGKIAGNPSASVSFENSWMQSRTFGGERGHEGTDIMASVNQRGIYPVYSMTDGVVENIGWLKLGGYRIGIRSPSGAYFYYAHLADYAKKFAVGESVSAGTFLGFMGDTGYSDVPGTTGKFAVHLHLGIYLNEENGAEFSVNSYPMLLYLQKCAEQTPDQRGCPVRMLHERKEKQEGNLRDEIR